MDWRVWVAFGDGAKTDKRPQETTSGEMAAGYLTITQPSSSIKCATLSVC